MKQREQGLLFAFGLAFGESFDTSFSEPFSEPFKTSFGDAFGPPSAIPLLQDQTKRTNTRGFGDFLVGLARHKGGFNQNERSVKIVMALF